MVDEFQIEGYWWLPSNIENKIAGVFHYTLDHTPILKVFGDLESNQDPLIDYFLSEKKPPLIILGEDEKANKITLVVLAFGKKFFNSSSTFPLLRYQIQYCLKGVHLSGKDDLIFNEIEITIESLTAWRNYYPVRRCIPIREGKSTTDFNLSYARELEPKFFNINNGFELSINHRAGLSDIYQEKVIIEQRQIASIKSDENTSFLLLLHKAYRFKSFLNMVSLRHNNFLTLNLSGADLYTNQSDQSKIYENIELFVHQRSKLNTVLRSGYNEDCLFDYYDVEDNFLDIIKKWFSFDKEMMPIIHHLIDSIEQKNTFRSTDFLIVVQALEGYHHRFFDKEPTKRKSLENRLKNLVNYFNREITYFRDINMEQVANTRNYYSHFYKKEGKIIEGIALYELTSTLRYLLICCLLHELGIDILKIKGILDKHIQN